jgi:glutamate synthase (NADPH/NADH) small chain
MRHADETPAAEVVRRFADIAPPLGPDAALVAASQCLFCYDAPCITACPTRIDVPSFIKKIASGNLRGSARVILDANPMGHSCARACPVEVLCEGACVLNARGEEPVKIALLQRHATDHALEKKLVLFSPGPATGKKVAIVGAGPAGLSAAQFLRRAGHAVTIFEARDLPGGLNTFGIAEYKMTRPVALAEAQMVLDLGVELRTGVAVGRDLPFETLLRDFDAALVAVGLGATRRLGIPGEDLPGVIDALAFIERVKSEPLHTVPVGRHVVVVGAGNTAIDAATQAKRLGAERVTLVYRKGPEDVPAFAYEQALAKSDGCEFRFHARPVRFVGTERLEGLETAGKVVIPCDMAIVAIGQEERAEFARMAGLTLEGGRFVSGQPNVFVAGDCANGGSEIVHAAAEGKAAAKAIDEFLAAGKKRNEKNEENEKKKGGSSRG